MPSQWWNSAVLSENSRFHSRQSPRSVKDALTVLQTNSRSQERFFTNTPQASVSQKTWKLYWLEKPFIKLRPAHSLKLVFLYVVKGVKIKITAKLRDTDHLCFEDTKRIMSPEKVSGLSRNGPLHLERYRCQTMIEFSMAMQYILLQKEWKGAWNQDTLTGT